MTKSKARYRLGSSRTVSVLTGSSAALVLVAAGQTATATAQPLAWQPPAASYAVSQPVHTTVTMDDGVRIAVEIVYPTDPGTGERASGTFPVLLTQNPYGTQRSDPADNGAYFARRGYVYVASAVRGTGDSGGQVDWFGDRQGEDGAALVDWAAHTLPGSDGKVGLEGCSYLGVNQWFTAAAVGKDSPLKAIAPFCTDSDFYNDLTADGGIPTSFVAGIGRAEPRGPEDDPATDPQSVTVAQQAAGGSRAYDDAYWQDRNVQKLMPRIVRNGIPALSEAGWQDLFPGGNLGAYAAAQNAYFGRPSTAPIRAGEPVTGRYQAIVGPWTHGEHVDEAALQAIRLEWFETWLKDAPTGMADTSTPLHLFENGAGSWTDSAAWPLSPRARTYYLGNGSLTAARPAEQGDDRLSWAASSTSDGTLTYTTAPLTEAALLDGPADVTVYAEATTTETELSATLSIVAPDGTVTKQADGVLLGSQRAVDTEQSWYGANGTLLKPVHPFTQASQRPVTPGRTTRHDISLLPSLTRIPAGYRIRISLTSGPPADFHYPVSPTPRQLADLAGGVYTVERSADAASFVNLPLTSPGTAHPSESSWGPAS
ncbi:CocE/NonD family hydrolase [Streptomyces hyaluromycini]|uniref:CocE/NonD family hydrolase n=1 Tax=Streptomyces hyaluromycini TaxID=1377993 RepID=A0ABV1WZ98_9ACTN